MIHILLLVFGIFLIGINLNAVRKEDKSFLSAFKNKEENITDVNIEIMGIRKDLAESILDLQHEIDELRQELNDIRANKEEKSLKYYEDNDDIINDNTKDVISDINYSNMKNNTDNNLNKNDKVIQIKQLIQQGKTDDEICNILSIGKGEVLLIRGLYKE